MLETLFAWKLLAKNERKFFPFLKKKKAPNSPPQWKHLTLVLQHQKTVIAIQQLQQLRTFLTLGLGLVYLGEYFQNEEAKGLKVLVFSPKAKKKFCFKVKSLVIFSMGKSY